MGVVPEIAARSHLHNLPQIVESALAEAKLDFAKLGGVAATAGPGLIGGVMVGLMAAKSIALVHHLPFFAVNHMEAHALTPRLTNDGFPVPCSIGLRRTQPIRCSRWRERPQNTWDDYGRRNWRSI